MEPDPLHFNYNSSVNSYTLPITGELRLISMQSANFDKGPVVKIHKFNCYSILSKRTKSLEDWICHKHHKFKGLPPSYTILVKFSLIRPTFNLCQIIVFLTIAIYLKEWCVSPPYESLWPKSIPLIIPRENKSMSLRQY